MDISCVVKCTSMIASSSADPSSQTYITSSAGSFSRLSSTATIRIYDLAGNIVSKISHTSGSDEIWDVKNNFGISVASGMYIAAVEADGCEKILKIAVITPEQRIDVY